MAEPAVSSARARRWRLRKKDLASARLALAIVSAVSVGTLCGWLTGRVDPDPNVIAAAIPAILSVAGVIVFAWSGARRNIRSAVNGAVFLLTFSVTFALGVIRTVESRDAAEEASIVDSLDRKGDLLVECSDAQEFINKYRASLGLEPLSFAEVCTVSR